MNTFEEKSAIPPEVKEWLESLEDHAADRVWIWLNSNPNAVLDMIEIIAKKWRD